VVPHLLFYGSLPYTVGSCVAHNFRTTLFSVCVESWSGVSGVAVGCARRAVHAGHRFGGQTNPVWGRGATFGILVHGPAPTFLRHYLGRAVCFRCIIWLFKSVVESLNEERSIDRWLGLTLYFPPWWLQRAGIIFLLGFEPASFPNAIEFSIVCDFALRRLSCVNDDDYIRVVSRPQGDIYRVTSRP